MHEIVALGVLAELRGHRPHHGQLVRACADLGEQVADGHPALAVGRNFQGLAMRLPLLLNWVRSIGIGIGLPWSRSSRGLGSNESTCETPPDM